MRKLVVSLAALALLAGGSALVTGVANAGSNGTGTPAGAAAPDETIVVVEREAKFKYVDVGAKGESVGDLLLARNKLFDEEGKRVGRVVTRCMLQFKPDLQCDGVYKLTGRGDIAFTNVVDTAKEPPLLGPITGGDGDFANIVGQLRLEFQGDEALTSLEIYYQD
jgi:hypothetical protein